MNPVNIIHVACSLNPSPGVVAQMHAEQAAASSLGIPWTCELYTQTSINPVGQGFEAVTRRLFRYVMLRVRFGFLIYGLTRRQGCHVVIRYAAGDPFQFLFSMFWRRYSTVHHTIEISELRSANTLIGRAQHLIEAVCGRLVISRSCCLICVTPEIARHQLSRLPAGRQKPVAIDFPNGVFVDMNHTVLGDRRGSRVELVMVASFFFDWHGLDRLLQSIECSKQDFALHIVGRVPEDLRARGSGDARLVFHDVLDEHQLSKVMSSCWVGLSSFALDRKGMTEACTLKVRDYLAAGLPVFSGHVDSGLPSGFRFFNVGPPDISDILHFAKSVRGTSRREVFDAAHAHISKQVLVSRAYRQICEAVASRG